MNDQRGRKKYFFYLFVIIHKLLHTSFQLLRLFIRPNNSPEWSSSCGSLSKADGRKRIPNLSETLGHWPRINIDRPSVWSGADIVGGRERKSGITIPMRVICWTESGPPFFFFFNRLRPLSLHHPPRNKFFSFVGIRTEDTNNLKYYFLLLHIVIPFDNSRPLIIPTKINSIDSWKIYSYSHGFLKKRTIGRILFHTVRDEIMRSLLPRGCYPRGGYARGTRYFVAWPR